MQKVSVNRTMQGISAIVVIAVAVVLGMNPEGGQKVLKNLFSYLTSTFDTLYLVVGFSSLIFLIYLAMSKYGDIVLAKDKNAPATFSKFTWTAMIFSAGVATGLILWGTIEWGYHFQSPPMGFEPKSKEALIAGLGYGIFHWGPTAWAFYCVPAVTIGYIFYCREKYAYNISEACRGVLGPLTDGILGKIIDYLFLFMILGASATTLAFGVPMISTAITEVFGIEKSVYLDISLIITTSLVFTLSARSGLAKGMAKLANFAVIVSIALFVYILVVGPTSFILKIGLESISFFANNFISMSLMTDPIATKITEDGTQILSQQSASFPQMWTVFYWAWWVVYGPFMGLFVTRISQGRTIREVIIGMLFWGTLGCTIFYGILGGYGMDLYLNGILDLPKMLNELGGAQTVIEVFKTLPMSDFILVLLAIIGVVFLATTFDSAASTMACVSTKGKLGEGVEPDNNNKLFWCLLIAILPIALLLIGGGMKPVQSASVLMALPTMLISIMMMITLLKFLKEDEVIESPTMEENSGEEIVLCAKN